MLFRRMQGSSADAVIAFTGLDPGPSDSGKKTGQKLLSKRVWPEIRRLMYAAAVSGARKKTCNGYCGALRDKGLSTTAALVVLARKLFCVPFSLFKKKVQFDARRVVVNA